MELSGDHLLIRASFDDIQPYLAWINSKVGAEVYRLPTEPEWEYAARAGTQTPFAQGGDLTTDQANLNAIATIKMQGEDRPEYTERNYPVPVDELDAANAWGLRHMSRNLFERTLSCWTDRHAGWALSSIHLKETAGDGCRRVGKGGSYSHSLDFSRLGYRGRSADHHRSDHQGYRLVRELRWAPKPHRTPC